MWIDWLIDLVYFCMSMYLPVSLSVSLILYLCMSLSVSLCLSLSVSLCLFVCHFENVWKSLFPGVMTNLLLMLKWRFSRRTNRDGVTWLRCTASCFRTSLERCSSSLRSWRCSHAGGRTDVLRLDLCLSLSVSLYVSICLYLSVSVSISLCVFVCLDLSVPLFLCLCISMFLSLCLFLTVP